MEIIEKLYSVKKKEKDESRVKLLKILELKTKEIDKLGILYGVHRNIVYLTKHSQ